jgi:hypothetical protein
MIKLRVKKRIKMMKDIIIVKDTISVSATVGCVGGRANATSQNSLPGVLGRVCWVQQFVIGYRCHNRVELLASVILR